MLVFVVSGCVRELEWKKRDCTQLVCVDARNKPPNSVRCKSERQSEAAKRIDLNATSSSHVHVAFTPCVNEDHIHRCVHPTSLSSCPSSSSSSTRAARTSLCPHHRLPMRESPLLVES